MDDQQARDQMIEGLKVAMLGTTDGDFIDPNSDIPAGEMFRLAAEYLAALPVAPEQPTQANEVVVAKLLRERISDLRDTSWVTMDYQVGFEAGARAALVSSPSELSAAPKETVTPERETISGRSVAEVKAEALREAREEFHDWEGVADVLDARAAALLANAPDEHFGVSS